MLLNIKVYEYNKFANIFNIKLLLNNLKSKNIIRNFADSFTKSAMLIDFSTIDECNNINNNIIITNIYVLFNKINNYYFNQTKEAYEKNYIISNLKKYIDILSILFKLLYYNKTEESYNCIIEMLEYYQLFVSIFNFIINNGLPTRYFLKKRTLSEPFTIRQFTEKTFFDYLKIFISLEIPIDNDINLKKSICAILFKNEDSSSLELASSPPETVSQPLPSQNLSLIPVSKNTVVEKDLIGSDINEVHNDFILYIISLLDMFNNEIMKLDINLNTNTGDIILIYNIKIILNNINNINLETKSHIVNIIHSTIYGLIVINYVLFLKNKYHIIQQSIEIIILLNKVIDYLNDGRNNIIYQEKNFNSNDIDLNILKTNYKNDYFKLNSDILKKYIIDFINDYTLNNNRISSYADIIHIPIDEYTIYKPDTDEPDTDKPDTYKIYNNDRTINTNNPTNKDIKDIIITIINLLNILININLIYKDKKVNNYILGQKTQHYYENFKTLLTNLIPKIRDNTAGYIPRFIDADPNEQYTKPDNVKNIKMLKYYSNFIKVITYLSYKLDNYYALIIGIETIKLLNQIISYLSISNYNINCIIFTGFNIADNKFTKKLLDTYYSNYKKLIKIDTNVLLDYLIYFINNIYKLNFIDMNDMKKLIFKGGNKNNYKKTENKITVIYKKKKYTRTIYICERKKYVKINKTYMLLSKLKKI